MATPIYLREHRSTLPRRPDVAETARVDADRLATELRQAIRGEVRFDRGSRALYATDGSNYRQAPIGVVLLVPW